jgi:hypothetical protein
MEEPVHKSWSSVGQLNMWVESEQGAHSMRFTIGNVVLEAGCTDQA